MALSFTSATGVNTATIPSHAVGDLILAFAYRDGNTTRPTIPAGENWTAIHNANGGSSNSHTVVAKTATSTGETAGTFTNATSVIILVIKTDISGGAISYKNGAVGTGASTTLSFTGFTLDNPHSSSRVVLFAGHRSVNTTIDAAPTGFTNITSVLDATDEAAAHRSTGIVSTFSTLTQSVGGTSSGWRTHSLEVYDFVPDTTAPTLTSPTGTATGATTASGSVSTDEANGTLYYWATENATETVANIKTNGASQAVAATGVQNVSFTGLTADTTYYAHYVHTDAASNDSARATSSTFTTDEPPPPVPEFTYVNSYSPSYAGSVYTQANAAIGAAYANRLVVVELLTEGNITLSSATIGGNAADVHYTVAGANGGYSVFSLVVPSGTTATIEATMSGTIFVDGAMHIHIIDDTTIDTTTFNTGTSSDNAGSPANSAYTGIAGGSTLCSIIWGNGSSKTPITVSRGTLSFTNSIYGSALLNGDTAGSHSFNWTWTSVTTGFRAGVICFAPAAGGGETIVDLTKATLGLSPKTVQNAKVVTPTTQTHQLTAKTLQNRLTVNPTKATHQLTGKTVQNSTLYEHTVAALQFTAKTIQNVLGLTHTIATHQITAKTVQNSLNATLNVATMLFNTAAVNFTIAAEVIVDLTVAALQFTAKTVQNILTVAITKATHQLTANSVQNSAATSVTKATLQLTAKTVQNVLTTPLSLATVASWVPKTVQNALVNSMTIAQINLTGLAVSARLSLTTAVATMASWTAHAVQNAQALAIGVATFRFQTLQVDFISDAIIDFIRRGISRLSRYRKILKQRRY